MKGWVLPGTLLVGIVLGAAYDPKDYAAGQEGRTLSAVTDGEPVLAAPPIVEALKEEARKCWPRYAAVGPGTGQIYCANLVVGIQRDAYLTEQDKKALATYLKQFARRSQ